MLCLTILEKGGDKKGFIDGTITKLDHIPNGVTDLYHTFEYCYDLTDAPTIPNSVINMISTFSLCSKLVNVPNIPNSVENICWAFGYCSNLVSVPNIPTSVTNVVYTFAGCKKLSNVYIESQNITNAANCFFNRDNTTINVYIPFNSTTHNSFVNAGYTTDGTKDGVYLKDINTL
jgi:hypothetical protein